MTKGEVIGFSLRVLRAAFIAQLRRATGMNPVARCNTDCYEQLKVSSQRKLQHTGQIQLGGNLPEVRGSLG
jgi:hypothetical protein